MDTTSEEDLLDYAVESTSNSDSATLNNNSSDEVHPRNSSKPGKRKRIEEDVDLEANENTSSSRRLTSRQLAMQVKEKVSSKENLSSSPLDKKRKLTEEEMVKKAQQAEKRKRQKEEQMVEQKDAILRKFYNAVYSRNEKTGEVNGKEKTKDDSRLSDIRYISGTSGEYLSFAPHVTLPNCISQKITVNRVLERCCGPNCKNFRRYYDSKTNRPLCSLLCYKALRETEVISI